MANRFIVWRAGLTGLMGGLAACSASGTSPPASTDARATCGAASVIVATSDYTSSEVGTLGIDGGHLQRNCYQSRRLDVRSRLVSRYHRDFERR